MNGLRQVWRDINRTPYPSLESLGVGFKPTVGDPERTSPARFESSGLTDKASRPRILIARPKTKPLNRNDKIRLSLERAYPSQARDILDQAYAAYYYTRPASANLPELYELLESGFLDQGIEACGLHSWVIGRSK